VRALPEPGVRGLLSLGLDLQARGRWHRAGRPGQVPRLAHVRQRLPLQKDLLQLEIGQGRKMHFLLSAHRSGPAHRVLGDLRRPHPLPRRSLVRCRPDSGSRQRGTRPRPVPGPVGHLPRPERSQGDSAGTHRRHSGRLDGIGPQEPGLQDGGGLESGAAAAPGIPNPAHGLVRAAALPHQRRGQCRPHWHKRRNSGCQARCASRSSTWPTC